MATLNTLTLTNPPARVAAASGGRSEPFAIDFSTDAPAPFVQLIVWEGGRQQLFRDDAVEKVQANHYRVNFPAGAFAPGRYRLQAEACRVVDPAQAGGGDWIKAFAEVEVERPRVEVRSAPRAARAGEVIYFGIHKHMHQPYYRAADPSYWDGEKTSIFDQRAGAYSPYLHDAVAQYIKGGLPHAGLSTSWSGSLIEQLERCEREELCYGHFRNWAAPLRAIAQERTALGNPRMTFSAFGHFHPLMPLIPARDIVRQIEWHRGIIERVFGVPASRVLFPPETAFHVRMIPALKQAGIEAVIYDSIHRARACTDYPYEGPQEGMLPPNRAEQVNPAAGGWMQLQNIWAGSKISPALLRPEYLRYEDADGSVATIIGVPAERYLGNEDARGGFGALQYPQVFGQLHDHLAQTGRFDPKHPPFFLLHSDGDNYGGGSDGYYRHNTERLVEWLQNDPRFALCTVDDYLQRFPPDPARAVHVEPGSWSGADNGDPQFMKWFSRYRDPYSPDLTSWAVLTALQNAVHTVEDADPQAQGLAEAVRLLLTAETSCYWYWTGQDLWDAQVTEAANAALAALKPALDALLQQGCDRTPPTIFPPWVIPENPGGKTWRPGALGDATRDAVAHVFVHDVSGLRDVRLVLRRGGREDALPMRDGGPYPARTGAVSAARLFTADLPAGAGDVRYYIEAVDQKGARARSALERLFLA